MPKVQLGLAGLRWSLDRRTTNNRCRGALLVPSLRRLYIAGLQTAHHGGDRQRPNDVVLA
jgi:hypothetical protein